MTDLNDPQTREDVLSALLYGHLNFSDFEVTGDRADPGIQLKYKTDECSVFVQMAPFAVQAYDGHDTSEANLCDMTWDQFEGDIRPPHKSKDYVRGYVEAVVNYYSE